MFAAHVHAVVKPPQLRALVTGIPLAEVVAERKNALLGPGLLFVAASTTDRRIELLGGDRGQQDRRLQPIAGGSWAAFFDQFAAVDRLLDRSDDEPRAKLRHPLVAKGKDLREVVAGIDVHHGERDLGRPESFFGNSQEDDGVFAAREEERWPFEFGRHLAHDENRFGFERIEIRVMRRRWRRLLDGHRVPFLESGRAFRWRAPATANPAVHERTKRSIVVATTRTAPALRKLSLMLTD